MDDVGRLDSARAVGWYRPDDTGRILRVMLPMIVPMAVGSMVVGFAYTKLKAIDPIGIEASAHPPEARTLRAPPAWHPPLGEERDRVAHEAVAPGGVARGGVTHGGVTRGRAHGGVGPRVDGVLHGPYRRTPAPPVRDATIPVHVWLLFTLGFLLVAAGPTSVLVSLGRAWRDDLFLLLRVDGLIHQTREGTRHVAWDLVERVEHDAGVVRLRMRDESTPYEIHERFAGIDPRALAAKLEEARRKASFGLLR